MGKIEPIHKIYGVAVLVLLGFLTILKGAPWPVIFDLALFVVGSLVPLALLVLAKRSLRSPVIHWVLTGIMCLVAAAILGDNFYDYEYPILVAAVAMLPSMSIFADLVLNSEIGRPPRTRFRKLAQLAQAEIVLSLIVLLILGLFYNAADNLGSAQYTLMLLALASMMYSTSTTEKYRDPLRIIAPLLIAGAWNVVVALCEFSQRQPGWLGQVGVASGFLMTAYKLGRSPVPDDWIEIAEVNKRPTQGLKRTPEGAT